MRHHRTAGASLASANHGPPWGHRVRGLGVCDALQLRLEPAQVPGLLDELDAHRTAHEQALAAAAATGGGAGETAEAAEEVERHRASLVVLQAIRDQIAPEAPGPQLVAGPAAVVSALVEGASRDAAEAPLAFANAGGTLSRDMAAQLLEAARTARAWAETLAELRELEWFSFETR